MGNFLNYFRRAPQSDIIRHLVTEAVPLLEGPQFEISRRDPHNLVTIGKNVFLKTLTNQFLIKRQTREFLGRFYIRFEKKDNSVAIGQNGQILAQEEFVHLLVSCLVQSDMSGYIFIGIKSPLFKELAKVEFTNLKRIQLVNCNVDSIEPITFINSDKFQTIYLGKNHITNVHSLAKTRFINFKSIDLDLNYMTELRPLNRAKTTVYSPHLKNKFFLFMTFEAFQSSDLSFMFKVQNTEISIVAEKSRAVNLIKRNRVLDALRRLQTQPQPVQN